MRMSISSLYRIGLLFLAASFVAPKINISHGFNITLLDMFPFYFILYTLLIFSGKRNIRLSKFQINILIILSSITIMMFLSTIHGFLIFQDFMGFLKSIAQFYRRFIVFLLIPVFIFLNPCKERNNLLFFSKNLILLVILTGFVGMFVNFNELIRQIYFNYIANSKQVFLFGLYRNMGLIGEASYFADIIIISLVLLFSLKEYFSSVNFVFTFIILVLILLTTVSKSSFIASLISLLLVSFIYFLNTCKISKKALISFFALLVIILTIIFFIKPYMKELFILASSSLQKRSNFMWGYFLDLFTRYDSAIVMGFGFKGLKSYFGFAGAHNQYLGFLIDFGVVFSIYILIVLFFLLPLYIYKHGSYRYATILLASYFFIQSFVHEPLYHFQVLGTYITTLLLFCMATKIKKENSYGNCTCS